MADCGFGLPERVIDTTGMFVVDLASLCQSSVLGRTMKELYAEGLFEGFDALADRRRGDVQVLSRGVEAAELDHRCQSAQLPGVELLGHISDTNRRPIASTHLMSHGLP